MTFDKKCACAINKLSAKVTTDVFSFAIVYKTNVIKIQDTSCAKHCAILLIFQGMEGKK